MKKFFQGFIDIWESFKDSFGVSSWVLFAYVIYFIGVFMIRIWAPQVVFGCIAMLFFGVVSLSLFSK